MNWTTTLPFILDNVDGDLKITYNPWGQKFYQNGQEIKRTGFSFAGMKYKVQTTDLGVINGEEIIYYGIQGKGSSAGPQGAANAKRAGNRV